MSHFSTFHSQPEVSSRPRAQNTRRPRITKDVFTAPKSKSDAFRVPKYKTVQNVVDDESEDQEEIDFTGVGPFYMGKFSVNGKGKEKEAIASPKARSPKRRKVAHDFGFLETSLPHATTPAPASDSAFAVPSSDLLKYIHHFACNYYSDRAQLFHESRTWRKKRKERRAREAAKAKLVAEDANSDDEEGRDEEGHDEEGHEADAPSETVTPQRRDMYKTMDGSALLAIGMLLQEHIARILAPRIPDGWEQGNLNESEEEEEFPHTEVQDTEDQDAEPEDERDEEGVGDGDEISGNEDSDGEEDEEDGEDDQDTDWMASEST